MDRKWKKKKKSCGSQVTFCLVTRLKKRRDTNLEKIEGALFWSLAALTPPVRLRRQPLCYCSLVGAAWAGAPGPPGCLRTLHPGTGGDQSPHASRLPRKWGAGHETLVAGTDRLGISLQLVCGGSRGWFRWMASPTQWTWVRAKSRDEGRGSRRAAAHGAADSGRTHGAADSGRTQHRTTAMLPAAHCPLCSVTEGEGLCNSHSFVTHSDFSI